ncbi:hypothetical protein FRB97_005375 [Tulasnella sp. 331]|nr:hypothetical protein FRB97_005375 [Tulasnella sp. 331]
MLVQLLAISAFVASGTTLASAASLSSLHSIWDDTWAEDWYTQYYVAGNGPLGIAVSSNPANDEVVLNLDTLWQGGPFSPYVRGMDFFSQQQTLLNNINVTQNNYTGGNPTEPLDPSILKGIRKEIMTNGNASVAALQTGYDGYGSYSTPGSFFVSRVGNATVSNYKRSTLFQEGKIQATWTEGKVNLQREYYCSYPTTSCHIHTNSTGGKAPATVNSFFTARPPSASNITCLSSSSLLYTSSADPTITEGMQFSFIAKVTVTGATTTCSSSTGAISISAGATDVFWSIVGDTQYDINKGTRETGYTFSNGKDTAAVAKTLIATVDALSASQIAAKHASDWSALYSGFELVLGDISEISDTKTTNASIEAFTWEKGDLLLENNVFNYGRYLLISCARGTLPASLQGVWSIYTYDDTISGYDLGAPWGSDFHADINLPNAACTPILLEQNYWGAESTNLGSLTTTLWDLVQKTWIPRGTETAALLYNSSGWVVHDEMNPFGHTAMKGGFDVASEWFILRGAAIAGETDQAFLANVANKLANMDKGAHIGSWGQLQEWGALDIDEPTDHHRHISHLYGMYPGTSLAAWNASSPSKSEIYSAVATSLQARGNGTDDSNTGWGKMHRAAVAATLGNATYSHNLYKYAIQENIVGNLFDHLGSIFQIEANLAAPGVVLQMLLQSHSSLSPQVVTLLPALPAAWSTGSISGARLRGGLGVSMTWANGKVTSGTITYDRGGPAARVVEVYEAGVLKKMGTLAFGESWSLV